MDLNIRNKWTIQRFDFKMKKWNCGCFDLFFSFLGNWNSVLILNPLKSILHLIIFVNVIIFWNIYFIILIILVFYYFIPFCFSTERVSMSFQRCCFRSPKTCSRSISSKRSSFQFHCFKSPSIVWRLFNSFNQRVKKSNQKHKKAKDIFISQRNSQFFWNFSCCEIVMELDWPKFGFEVNCCKDGNNKVKISRIDFKGVSFIFETNKTSKRTNFNYFLLSNKIIRFACNWWNCFTKKNCWRSQVR